MAYFSDAIVAKVRGSILPWRRKACFSPGESSSSGLVVLVLLLGVNFDLSRAVIELVVDVLRSDELSDAFDGLRSEIEDWLEDMVVVVAVGMVLVSKMEGSRMNLLLNGVGRAGRTRIVRVLGISSRIWRQLRRPYMFRLMV